MSTFGKTTIGAGRNDIVANYKQVSKYTLSENGTVTKLTIYLDAAGSGADVAQVLKGVVYSDSAGSPDALKGTSDEVTIPATPFTAAWVDFTFAAPFALTTGDYWLGFIAGDSSNHARFGRDTVTNNRKFDADTYVGGATDPFGTADGTDDDQIDVYATYIGTPTRVYKRLYGPAQLTGSAADLYTVPASTRTRILGIHASNPTGTPRDINLSIGADAAATRVYDGYSIPADSVLPTNFAPYDLAAGEKIQGWASAAGAVVLTISGWEQPA